MSQNTELQERYAPMVEAKLRATSVFANLFNNRYEGTPAAGAVKVAVRADATAGAYTISTGGDLATPSTSYATIVCDKDFYVNELIDGYYAAAVPDGLVADRLDSAAFALADKIDTELVSYVKTTGTASAKAATAASKTNIYGLIVEDIQAAKALKVNPASMWVVVSCAALGLLSQSDEFLKATGSVAELGAGYRGMIMGIPVYESANLTQKDYVVGNSDFCHFVGEWSVPVAVKDLADGKHIGASAVQGRRVSGWLLSKPTTVIIH